MLFLFSKATILMGRGRERINADKFMLGFPVVRFRLDKRPRPIHGNNGTGGIGEHGGGG